MGNYTWEGHLEAEQAKKENEEKELVQPTENLDASAPETITQEPVKKKKPYSPNYAMVFRTCPLKNV